MPWLLPMPPVRGGAVETLVDSLLRENEKTGRYQITVFSPYDELAEKEYPKYKFVEFAAIHVPQWQHKLAGFIKSVLWKLFHIGCTPGAAYLCAVLRAMRGRKFDRIVVQNQAPFVPPIARLGAGPVDLHMHNIAIDREQSHPERVSKDCRRILCVSDYICKWLRAHIGDQPEKYRLFLNCIDVQRFADGRKFRDEMRLKYAIGEDEIVYLFSGRLCREKGTLELAKAFCMLDMPNTKLVIVGSAWFDSDQINDYQREIQQTLMPVQDRVIFTGYVHQMEIGKYYAMADVAVMPSIWDEPAGLTVLEAQAAGLPLISTQSGGIPQHTCPDGAILLERSEKLVEQMAQSMRQLAEDETMRIRMGNAAASWSVDRNEEVYFETFSKLIDET